MATVTYPYLTQAASPDLGPTWVAPVPCNRCSSPHAATFNSGPIKGSHACPVCGNFLMKYGANCHWSDPQYWAANDAHLNKQYASQAAKPAVPGHFNALVFENSALNSAYIFKRRDWYSANSTVDKNIQQRGFHIDASGRPWIPEANAWAIDAHSYIALDFFERFQKANPETLTAAKPSLLCECGAHKTGTLDHSPLHSRWCPAFSDKPKPQQPDLIQTIRATRKGARP